MKSLVKVKTGLLGNTAGLGFPLLGKVALSPLSLLTKLSHSTHQTRVRTQPLKVKLICTPLLSKWRPIRRYNSSKLRTPYEAADIPQFAQVLTAVMKGYSWQIGSDSNTRHFGSNSPFPARNWPLLCYVTLHRQFFTILVRRLVLACRLVKTR